MARPINVKEVNTRIKANKAIMRKAKTELNNSMAAALKDDPSGLVTARSQLSTFITASKAVVADSNKL